MREYRVVNVGDIDVTGIDDKWQNIQEESLVDNTDGGKSGFKTTFRLCYTDNALYFMFDVDDINPKSTMTGYNEPIYDEEAVEFFFASTCDKRDYLELEFNHIGGVFAANIDNDLKGHTHINFIKNNPVVSNIILKDNGFYVVGRVGRNTFKGDFDKWLFNAYRIKRDENNGMILSAFSPTYQDNFHKPDYFAELTFVK